MSESLLTAKDLSEVLRVSVRQVRRLVAGESLPAPVYIGRLPRWRETEISAWMQAGCPDRQRWETARKAVSQ
ncbi:MAG TPA: helix-turn-helix domain-containing protein [Gemmataceae bacterium]|jgi:excisionase family DNA binding protein